ncbi:MAG: hypothetical protein ACI8TX_001034 [Hyphomicrobiaceae bacterium]|jgi:hypothetical protein
MLYRDCRKSPEVNGLRKAIFLAAVAFSVGVTGCSAMQDQVPPGARTEDSGEGPAFFTQATDEGIRYAHNWVERPCFTVDLPGHNWQLQETTADYVLYRRGINVLKIYLTDNRNVNFAVSGMKGDGVLRAFVGAELDYVAPKFAHHYAAPPRMKVNEQGSWALWRWEGRDGKRAGVGKAQAADQKHMVASLWIDPWVLSFDFATTDLEATTEPTGDIREILESLLFHPKCFRSMRSGETWGDRKVRIETAAPSAIGEDRW